LSSSSPSSIKCRGKPADRGHGHPAAGHYHARQRLHQSECGGILPRCATGQAIVEVENFLVATSQLSQTTLRSILGQSALDEILAERDKINSELQKIIDLHTEPWGIKISNVEVKQIDLPVEMQRAMARQAEAERERRRRSFTRRENSGIATACRSSTRHRRTPDSLATALSSDAHGDRLGEEFNDDIPCAIDLIAPFLDAYKASKKHNPSLPSLQAIYRAADPEIHS